MPRLKKLPALVLLTGVTACSPMRNQAKECVVWAEAHNKMRGQVYVTDGHSSFTAGLSWDDIAFIKPNQEIVLETADGPLSAAKLWNGQLYIQYLPEPRFVSDPIEQGFVTLRSETHFSQYRYNSACSIADASVGATSLFHLVYPSRPTTAPL